MGLQVIAHCEHRPSPVGCVRDSGVHSHAKLVNSALTVRMRSWAKKYFAKTPLRDRLVMESWLLELGT